MFVATKTYFYFLGRELLSPRRSCFTFVIPRSPLGGHSVAIRHSFKSSDT